MNLYEKHETKIYIMFINKLKKSAYLLCPVFFANTLALIKMKYLSYILAILIFTSCKSKRGNIDYQSNYNIPQKHNRKQTTIARTYILDSAYLDYDYKKKLKNGYKLEYQVYVEPNSTDTLQTIVLMNGTIKIKDLNEGSYGLPHKNIGYVGADFDNSFVFVQSFGSGNPHYFQLIDKESGKSIRSGIFIDTVEKEQVLVYLAETNEKIEKLKIYDVKNSNEIIATGFEKSKCLNHVIGGLRNCIEIDTITKNSITLKINTNKEKITKKYPR